MASPLMTNNFMNYLKRIFPCQVPLSENHITVVLKYWSKGKSFSLTHGQLIMERNMATSMLRLAQKRRCFFVCNFICVKIVGCIFTHWTIWKLVLSLYNAWKTALLEKPPYVKGNYLRIKEISIHMGVYSYFCLFYRLFILFAHNRLE